MKYQREVFAKIVSVAGLFGYDVLVNKPIDLWDDGRDVSVAGLFGYDVLEMGSIEQSMGV